jgi:hypothetical protein
MTVQVAEKRKEKSLRGREAVIKMGRNIVLSLKSRLAGSGAHDSAGGYFLEIRCPLID